VSLRVGHDREPCKNSRTDKDAFIYRLERAKETINTWATITVPTG